MQGDLAHQGWRWDPHPKGEKNILILTAKDVLMYLFLHNDPLKLRI